MHFQTEKLDRLFHTCNLSYYIPQKTVLINLKEQQPIAPYKKLLLAKFSLISCKL